MSTCPKTEFILRWLEKGAVVLSAYFDNPHSSMAVINAIYSTYPQYKDYQPSQFKKTFDRLKKRKLIKFIKNKNETIIELSELGRKEIIHYDLKSMKIDNSKRWDGKWWMVIFDIPNKKKKSRDSFQKKLKTLGFYFIQESVGLYPYPCQKEIEFLREIYDIKKYVNIFHVEYFEDEYLVKDIFNL